MNHDLLRFFARAKRLACLWLLAGACLFPSVSHASFKHAQWSSGAVIDWAYGTIQPSAQFMPAVQTNVGSGASWGVSPSGAVTGSATGRFPVGSSGSVVDVQAKVVPRGASVGRAIVNAAKKGLWPIAAGVAIYELAGQLGYRPRFDPEKGVVFQEPASGVVCTVSPCYEWKIVYANGSSPFQGTLSECMAFTNLPGVTITYVQTSDITYDMYRDGALTNSNYIMRTTTTYEPGPEAWADVEDQEFIDSIANQSGWPSSSAIAEALSQALESGETVEPESVTVTGPPSVAGPSKTTQNSDGTSTTQNTTYNITYNNNTYNVSTVTTTVHKDASGNPTAESTTTEEEQDPPTDCEKDPDMLSCRDTDVPDDEVPKASKNVTFTPENVGLGAGTCPAPIGWTDSLGSHSINLAPVCDKLSSVVRPIVLAFALLAAFFIVAPVRSEG